MISLCVMKVRPVDPAAVIRFPNDLAKHRQLAVDGENVPDDDIYWTRRLLAREVVRCDEPGTLAPIAPLTTR